MRIPPLHPRLHQNSNSSRQKKQLKSKPSLRVLFRLTVHPAQRKLASSISLIARSSPSLPIQRRNIGKAWKKSRQSSPKNSRPCRNFPQRLPSNKMPFLKLSVHPSRESRRAAAIGPTLATSLSSKSFGITRLRAF